MMRSRLRTTSRSWSLLFDGCAGWPLKPPRWSWLRTTTTRPAVEPDTGLITATALTPANAADGPTGVEVLAGEQPGLQVLADSSHGSG